MIKRKIVGSRIGSRENSGGYDRIQGKIVVGVRHVTGNDKDYLRKIPRVVW